jgi:hypothetical protein
MTGSAFQMTAQDSAKTAQNWGVHKLDYVSEFKRLISVVF